MPSVPRVFHLITRLCATAGTALLLLAASMIEATPANGQTPATAPRVLPRRTPPFLYADAARFQEARAKAARLPWARRQLDTVTSEAEELLAGPVKLPADGAQWGHYYVCRKCAANLQEKEGKHVCSKCGLEHSGWPYDQVAAGRVHSRYWHGVQTLGLAYQFTGEERYAARAREILLAYAGKYLSYPYHDYKGGTMPRGARVYAQTLDESVHGIPLVWGYDLVAASPTLTSADHDSIRDGLLRPLVETIRRNDMGISNWQTWHNALKAAVGFCLEDARMVTEALDGPSGFRFQLKNSVLSDGFWYEGSPSYHYYALEALRWTAEAVRAAGFEDWQDPVYKKLFDAPLAYTFPDFRFPAVNDSTVVDLRDKKPLYEHAFSCFRDPAYAHVLQAKERSSLEALLWGVEQLPRVEPPAATSTNFPGLGAAVLRRGSGKDAMYAHLDYGAHGGAHGHYDKLGLIFFALGKQLAPDPGALKYSSPLHTSWYKTTFAHNTLCVDQKSQKATEGKLTLFQSEDEFSACRAETSGGYTGVRVQRTLILTDSYLLDVTEADSDSSHTYDWVYHNEGELAPGMGTTPREHPLGSSHGYQHMTGITEAGTSATWSAEFRQKGAALRLTLEGGTETLLYFGTGMTERPPRPSPMLVARRAGTTARFIALLEPYRKNSVLSATPVQSEIRADGSVAITVSRTGGKPDRFLIPPATEADGSSPIVLSH